MKKAILFILMIPILLWAAPKEQDRAILEKGDRELLSNPGFEGRLAAWTKTGSSTLTLESVSPGFGKLSGKWNPSATGEFLSSPNYTVPEGLKNRNKCSMDFEYKWAGVAGEIKAQIYDGSTVLAEVDLDPSTDWRKSPPLLVTCPASGTIAWRLESTANAAEISLDSAHLGTLKTLTVSQTTIVGTAYTPPTTNCSWATSAAPPVAVFAADVDCPIPTLTGELLAPATKVPGVIVPNVKAGKYVIDIQGVMFTSNSTVANGACSFKITDGTTTHAGVSVFQDVNQGPNDNSTLSATFEYSANQGDVQFEMVAALEQGNGFCEVPANIINRELVIRVTKYPASSAEAITLETVGWHIDANIGGGNVNLQGTNVTPYTGIELGTYDLVINSSKGSKPAEIPCSTTNPSTGLTCAAGNESLGLSFDIPTAGRYRVCTGFTHVVQTSTTGIVEAYFQLVETGNADQIIAQTGDTRTASGVNTVSAVNQSVVNADSFCSNFTFNSVGKKTIRLMYVQTAGGSVALNIIAADRVAGAQGDRDVHFTVEKMDQQFPTPVFTDLTNSLNNRLDTGSTSNLRTCYFSYSDVEAVTILEDLGGCVDSSSDNGSSDLTTNFTAGYFSVAPNCRCQALNGSGSTIGCIAFPPTTGGLRVRTFLTTTGAASNAAAHLSCTGPK